MQYPQREMFVVQDIDEGASQYPSESIFSRGRAMRVVVTYPEVLVNTRSRTRTVLARVGVRGVVSEHFTEDNT